MLSNRSALKGPIQNCGILSGLLLAATLLAAPLANIWAQSTSALEPRQFAAVAHDLAAGQFLLFGGTYGNGSFDDTWSFGSTGWTLQTPLIQPGARISAAAAFDNTRNEYVLFGGRAANVRPFPCTPEVPEIGVSYQLVCGDTWVYRGSAWIKQTPSTKPTEREGHAMAFDAATKQVVMFGGMPSEGTEPLADTWVWNGTTWKQVITAHRPPARYGHVMAYDPINKQVVMFGGNGGSTILNDTWLWNGTDWLPSPPQDTPPTPLTGAGMDYSPTLGVVVLFSGTEWDGLREGVPSPDSWNWNGLRWTKYAAADFNLVSDFKTLTAAETKKAILSNGSPSTLWIPN